MNGDTGILECLPYFGLHLLAYLVSPFQTDIGGHHQMQVYVALASRTTCSQCVKARHLAPVPAENAFDGRLL